MITSTLPSGSGCFRSRLSGTQRSPHQSWPGCPVPAPAFRRSCRVRRLSRSDPRARAESSTSIPPPDPRSNTISPSDSAAKAVGFPQPRDASTASSGKHAVSTSEYRCAVTDRRWFPWNHIHTHKKRRTRAWEHNSQPALRRRPAEPPVRYLSRTMARRCSAASLSPISITLGGGAVGQCIFHHCILHLCIARALACKQNNSIIPIIWN